MLRVLSLLNSIGTMRKSFYILIFSISSLLLCSCEKEPLTNGGAPYYPIFNGYMQFSTEVSTRAQLATSMRGRDFGVIGYQFSSTTDWGAAKPLSSPLTFYNQKISCAAATGICTYDVDNTKDG